VSAVRVRPAHLAEAATLAEMANDLNDHVGIHGRPFTPERIRADGFGPQAAFTPLVAELDGAARSVFLHDIFVTSAARGRGAGHAPMAAVAAETVRLGGVSLEWGVHVANAGALEFYRRLGAVGAEVRIMGLNRERLRALADAAS
jgi:GNAT superfamily N-acetyltransferase